MRHKNLLAVLALLVAFALGFGTSSLMAEVHPEIRAAQRALANAMDHLEKAAHDFGGHRVKAIEHIRQAQAELTAAQQFDR
jgi:membrane protein required for beta-lactamase induction